MSLYTRARKHIDMDRVKELREEKIKREQIAEILRQQEEIRAELEYIEAEESKYVDWRRDLENLNETMTTASMGMINLPAEGNVDIIDTDTTMDNINSSLSQNDSRSGNTITLQGTENQIGFYPSGHLVTDAAIQWVDQRLKEQDDQPFFLWLHYFDPHSLYMNHPDLHFGNRPVDLCARPTRSVSG